MQPLAFKSDSFDGGMRDRLSKGVPLVVEVLDIVDGNTVKAGLIMPAFGLPADTAVHVVQADFARGYHSLANQIEGTERTPKLQNGDLLTFNHAIVLGDDIYVGSISGRSSDAMVGPVQFVRAMARASLTTVSERGATQSLTIIDGSGSWGANDADDVRAAYKQTKERKWPGGQAGMIARSSLGKNKEYFVSKDRPLEAFIDDIVHDKWFVDGANIEIIPAWRVQIGADQVARDVNIKENVTQKIGNVGKMYFGKKFPGFLPSAIILCDEDEWAFKAKTGKRMRVAAAVQPLARGVPVEPRNLITRANPKANPLGIDELYREETMATMAAARAERRPEPSPTQAPAPTRGNSRPFRPDMVNDEEKKPFTFNMKGFGG